MDGGAWWATVHGVAKSWTRLKRQQQQQQRLRAHALQQEKPSQCESHALQLESSLRSLQLGKAPWQQCRPSTAKNKYVHVKKNKY